MALATLTTVRAGHPFRGAIVPLEQGPARVVQLKDVDPLHGVRWEAVVRCGLPGRKPPQALRRGDVLFIARGPRFYAVPVLDVPLPQVVVCSPHFFHLRCQSGAAALPAFLAWQINQLPVQQQLARAAAGSVQRSIRRATLEALQLAVPALAQQRRIVALVDLARREAALLAALRAQREDELALLALQLAQAAQ